MRATDGRPYELQSVPTKTVAVRSTDNGADLVQKFCAAPCLPLKGKVSAKPTDEVKFKSVRRSRTPQLFTIHYSFAGIACTAGLPESPYKDSFNAP